MRNIILAVIVFAIVSSLILSFVLKTLVAWLPILILAALVWWVWPKRKRVK